MFYMAIHALLTAIQFAVVPVATETALTRNASDEDELWSETQEPSMPAVGRVRTFVAEEEVTNTYLFTSDVEFEPSASAEMD